MSSPPDPPADDSPPPLHPDDPGAHLSLAEPEDDQRPEILMSTAELHRTVSLSLGALEGSERVFVRSGILVTAPNDEDGRRSIRALKPEAMAAELTRAARYVKLDGSGVRGASSPSSLLTRAILQSGEYPMIRPLRGVTVSPTLREDGTVLVSPGYDERSGLLYQPSRKHPPMRADPSMDDAKAAAEALYEVVTDFPFSTAADRSAWLASVLTLCAPYAVDGCRPLFAIEASSRGSGKTLLVSLAGLVAHGQEPPMMSPPPNDEEMGKRITTALMAGRAIQCIDNVTSLVGWPSLDNAITSGRHTGRILGGSVDWEGPCDTIWFLTANNARWRSDVLRRVLRIRLVPDCERPEDRDGWLHPDLKRWVKQHHPRLLAAALTILCAFRRSKSKPELPPWGSFEAWSELIRGAIVWMGLPDPADTRATLVSTEDTQRSALANMLDAWPNGEKLTASELRRRIEDPGPNAVDYFAELREAVQSLVWSRDGRLPSSVKIGQMLAKHRDTVADGRRVVRAGTRKRAVIWDVVEVG